MRDISSRLAAEDAERRKAQVVLGQIGEHVEPEPEACRECGKSATACGRSVNFCCAACSQSRFATHDPSASPGGVTLSPLPEPRGNHCPGCGWSSGGHDPRCPLPPAVRKP